MGASTAANAEFPDAGKPVAQPFYLVDVNGNTLSFSTIAGNVNLNQVNGSTVALGQTTASASIPVVLASNQYSSTNPVIIEQNLQNFLRNAQIFTVTTGAQATASQTSGACLFNASSGKNAYVFSIFVMNSNPGQGIFTSVRKVTSNPAYSNAIVPVCTVLSSANTSLLSPTWQASASVTGTDLGTDNYNAGSNSKDVLQLSAIPGRGFFLGSAANTGVSVFVGQGGTSGFWSVTFTWAEF